MERIAQVGVGTAARRATRGKLAEHESSKERDDSAARPGNENQSGYGYSLRYDRWRAENARADDAADHDEHDVGDAETPRER
jgi:hypothetical protein